HTPCKFPQLTQNTKTSAILSTSKEVMGPFKNFFGKKKSKGEGSSSRANSHIRFAGSDEESSGRGTPSTNEMSVDRNSPFTHQAGPTIRILNSVNDIIWQSDREW
ncbi:hypothetical protein, partial [Aeromonas jandaei]|uniref:hypothetical protein n=1 Tax=Aeromonas jandaei TaxID=650 RepID=UPI001E3DFE9E